MRACYGMTLGHALGSIPSMTEEIVQRPSPPPPWWALSRYGQYQLVLGLLDSALTAFQCALPLAPTKAGEGTTLYSMEHIAWQAEDGERAITLWIKAYSIGRETQNAQLLFSTAYMLGLAFASTQEREQARQLLQLAVEVGNADGFPGVEEVEALLRSLPAAEA